MPCSEEAAYLTLMHKEWLENWPEEDVLWPDCPMEQRVLSEGEKAVLCLAENERKHVSVYAKASRCYTDCICRS